MAETGRAGSRVRERVEAIHRAAHAGPTRVEGRPGGGDLPGRAAGPMAEAAAKADPAVDAAAVSIAVTRSVGETAAELVRVLPEVNMPWRRWFAYVGCAVLALNTTLVIVRADPTTVHWLGVACLGNALVLALLYMDGARTEHLTRLVAAADIFRTVITRGAGGFGAYPGSSFDRSGAAYGAPDPCSPEAASFVEGAALEDAGLSEPETLP